MMMGKEGSVSYSKKWVPQTPGRKRVHTVVMQYMGKKTITETFKK